MSEKMLHIVAMIGIACGILGASPIGRIVFRDPEPPQDQKP